MHRERVVVNGVWFHSEAASERWEIIQKRKVVADGILQEKRWNIPEIVKKLEVAGMIKVVKCARLFSEQLVREFIVNITE